MHVQCSNLSFFYIFIIRVNELLLETSILLQIRCCTWSQAHLLCFSTPTASHTVKKSAESPRPSQGVHRGTYGVWLYSYSVRGEEMGGGGCTVTCCLVASRGWAVVWPPGERHESGTIYHEWLPNPRFVV